MDPERTPPSASSTCRTEYAAQGEARSPSSLAKKAVSVHGYRRVAIRVWRELKGDSRGTFEHQWCATHPGGCESWLSERCACATIPPYPQLAACIWDFLRSLARSSAER